MPRSSSVEVPLKKWASDNKTPYRTACQWRLEGKIPARRVRTKRTVTLVRTVTEYVVRSDVKPPECAR